MTAPRNPAAEGERAAREEGVAFDAAGHPLCSVERAAEASDAEHAAAIATTRCVLCGAAPSTECTYGASGGRPAQAFPGKAHTRRVRAYPGAVAVARAEAQ